MKNTIYLLFDLLSTLAKLIQPGGSRSVIAENLLLKQQLIIIRPSTLLSFHNARKKRKYRQLYSPAGGRKPGPKGPSIEVINAIVEMKGRNPRYGCPRIAQQINLAFGLGLYKDTVRRVLAVHYKPDPNNRVPSWLTTIGHTRDSLWSVDLFRCESIPVKSHWVMATGDRSIAAGYLNYQLPLELGIRHRQAGKMPQQARVPQLRQAPTPSDARLQSCARPLYAAQRPWKRRE